MLQPPAGNTTLVVWITISCILLCLYMELAGVDYEVSKSKRIYTRLIADSAEEGDITIKRNATSKRGSIQPKSTTVKRKVSHHLLELCID